MSVTFDENYKNKVAFSIIVRINQAIKSGDLPDNELCEVCTYVTVALKSMKSNDELTDFLLKMTYRWNFFEDVLNEVKNQNKVIGNIENSLLNRTGSKTAAS